MNKKIKEYFDKFTALNRQNKILVLFMSLLLICQFVFVIQFIIGWISGGTPFAVSLFFQNRIDSFMDFFNVNYFVAENSPYMIKGSSYPPLPLLFAKFFALFGDYSLGSVYVRQTVLGAIGLIVFFAVAYAGLFFALNTYLKRKNWKMKWRILLFFMLFFSAPNLFLFQRGNYLIYSLMFSALFLLYYNSQSKVKRELAYLALAAAVGIKLYPAALGLLLLKEKKILPLLRTAAYSALLLVLPFMFFVGGFGNIPVFFENLRGFSNYKMKIFEPGYPYIAGLVNDYSVTGMLIVAGALFGGSNIWNSLPVFNIVGTIIGILIIIVTFCAGLLKAKRWQIVALCSIAAILIPAPSYHYAVVVMIPPLVAFLCEKEKRKLDFFYMALFLLIMSPMQLGYFVRPEDYYLMYGATWSNLLSFFAIAAMFVTVSAEIFINKFKQIRNKASAVLAQNTNESAQ